MNITDQLMLSIYETGLNVSHGAGYGILLTIILAVVFAEVFLTE